jgi:hypothetical protein
LLTLFETRYVNPSSYGGGGVPSSYVVDAFLDEAGRALERRGIEDGVFEGIDQQDRSVSRGTDGDMSNVVRPKLGWGHHSATFKQYMQGLDENDGPNHLQSSR